MIATEMLKSEFQSEVTSRKELLESRSPVFKLIPSNLIS